MNRQAGRGGFFSRCVCCEPVPAFTGPPVSRRNFLSGGAAATALGSAGAATLAAPPAAAQAPAKPRRIDVHHHIVPPVHAEALARHKSTNPVKWTADMSLEDMDKAGVDTAVVSILNPGVWFGKRDEEARSLARACNEYADDLERDHKGRFRP